MKRHLLLILLVLFTASTLIAQYTEKDIHLYIEKYKDLAIQKMYEYKIPASITLAQGVFESACGTSRLATYGNNHFGIKCHKEWMGDTLLVDDDASGECFRKYKRVEESFDDHSLFLTSRSRYEKLFTLDIMDYEAWAHGLKTAGYATNPQYAHRLISLIERFEIAKYDTTYLERLESGYFERGMEVEQQQQVTETVTGKIYPGERAVKESPTTVPAGLRVYFKVDPKQYKPVSYPFSDRVVYENNRVHFIITGEGETFASIGQDVQLTAAVLRSYNNAEAGIEPQPDEVIYVERKAKAHPAGVHIVKSGETLRFISQQYGIRLDMLLRYNNLKINSIIHPGQEIKLKK